MHRVEVAYNNLVSSLSKADDRDSLDTLVEQVVAAYELTDWQELVPVFQEQIAAVGTEAATIAFRQQVVIDAVDAIDVSITGAFGQVNQAALDYAHERAAELVGMKWVDGSLVPNPNAAYAITDTTRDWISDRVAAAFEEGMSPAQLADELEASQAFSASRAEMIARTEVSNANVASLMQASLAAGATHKRCSLSADHPDDDDDICVDAADAGEVPINYDYGLEQLAPLFHPRCKCSISTYVRKPK